MIVGNLGRARMMPGMQMLQMNPTVEMGRGMQKKEERVPQWSPQETRELIGIRAELERDFTVTKRNKMLWEAVSTKMKDRGYSRSPDQCKCKWKNLVNRYKGKETSDPEHGRQCPFFNELHAIFTERAKSMQRMLQEDGRGARAKDKMKRLSGERSSDDFSEAGDDDEDDSEEDRSITRSRKKRPPPPPTQEMVAATTTTTILDKVKARSSSIQEMLQELFQQQQRMEMQWQEAMDRRAQERRMLEQEWRISMEKLETERLLMEQAWREREEQRRMREERRAEKRDALLTTLLNRLIHERL